MFPSPFPDLTHPLIHCLPPCKGDQLHGGQGLPHLAALLGRRRAPLRARLLQPRRAGGAAVPPHRGEGAVDAAGGDPRDRDEGGGGETGEGRRRDPGAERGCDGGGAAVQWRRE